MMINNDNYGKIEDDPDDVDDTHSAPVPICKNALSHCQLLGNFNESYFIKLSMEKHKKFLS